jgi:hypothetical protein
MQEEVKKKFFGDKDETVEDEEEDKEKITAGPLLGISLLEARAEAIKTGADKRIEFFSFIQLFVLFSLSLSLSLSLPLSPPFVM